MDDVLILGAGIFGTSAAYHLSKDGSRLSITVVDRHPFPAPDAGTDNASLGASCDINKIVRADYSVPFYMNLGHEAIEAWSSWKVISKFYHRTGWIAFGEEGSDLVDRVRKNFKECGKEDVTEDISLDEAKTKWNGVLQDMNTTEIKSAYFNPVAGWVRADKAVASMLDESITQSKGSVKYYQGEIAKMILNEDGNGLKGVQLADGKLLYAKKVLLATGAWTSKILSPVEDSLGFKGEERMESQVKACGVVAMHWQLEGEDMRKYDPMPVIIYGERADIQPPSSSGLLKMTLAESFTNTELLPLGEKVTVPPHPEISQYEVPEKLKAKALETMANAMPSLLKNGTEISYWRLCWDAITPAQHQLITKHPDSRLGNLYLAVGGSFHSWKFLPIIGKYISNVINGNSNGEEKDRNWAWKQHGCGQGGLKGAHEKVLPTAEWREYY